MTWRCYTRLLQERLGNSGTPQTNIQRRFKWKLTFSNVPPSVFNSGIPINIGEQPEAETVLIVGRIGETVHQHTCGGGMERFAHAVIELIVDNRAPVFWLLISHRLHVCRKEQLRVSRGECPGRSKPETVVGLVHGPGMKTEWRHGKAAAVLMYRVDLWCLKQVCLPQGGALLSLASRFL